MDYCRHLWLGRDLPCPVFGVRRPRAAIDPERPLSFYDWYLREYLRGLGWPRKKGLRRQRVISKVILHGAVRTLAQTGGGLGAGHPDLGCRAIAHAFADRDWEGEGATDLLAMLDLAEMIDEEAVDTPPWEVFTDNITPMYNDETDSIEDTVSADILTNLETRIHIAVLWSSSIYFGLTHPDTVRNAVTSFLLGYNERAPRWREVGLNAPAQHPWANANEFYSNCADFVSAYTSATGLNFPPIPRSLREAPAIVARLGPATAS